MDGQIASDETRAQQQHNQLSHWPSVPPKERSSLHSMLECLTNSQSLRLMRSKPVMICRRLLAQDAQPLPPTVVRVSQLVGQQSRPSADTDQRDCFKSVQALFRCFLRDRQNGHESVSDWQEKVISSIVKFSLIVKQCFPLCLYFSSLFLLLTHHLHANNLQVQEQKAREGTAKRITWDNTKKDAVWVAQQKRQQSWS